MAEETRPELNLLLFKINRLALRDRNELNSFKITMFAHLAIRDRGSKGLGKPDTFAFLVFTPICGSNKGGAFFILRHTIRERLREKLRHRMRTALKEAVADLTLENHLLKKR